MKAVLKKHYFQSQVECIAIQYFCFGVFMMTATE